jgi:dolichyl-phosphate-mannose--protein O-mannosyl transferase
MKKHSFFYRNSPTIVLVVFFLACIFGQIFTGWHEHNKALQEHGVVAMMSIVVLSFFLRQYGSSESSLWMRPIVKPVNKFRYQHSL